MQDKLQIRLPNVFGKVDFENKHGTLTVAVVDTQMKPVQGLAGENFILEYDSKIIQDIEVSEQVVGVYTLRFPIDEAYLKTLKIGGRQIMPLVVALSVKQGSRESDSRHITLY